MSVGKTFPSVVLHNGSPANAVNIGELVSKGTSVVFGVPGAFTPGCSKTHLPGYIADYDKLKAAGVDRVICTSVNDAFVMDAWGKAHGADGKVMMLADPLATLAKELGVEKQLDVLGGLRSKRYSAVVKDGVITAWNVEPDGTGLSCSLSNGIFAQLK